MQDKAGPGCLGGCFAMLVCLLVGAPLSYIGYYNIRARQANPEIRRASLGELVNTRAETPLWVEVSGVPVEGSRMTLYGVDLMLLLDPESKVAVYVMPDKESPLLNGGDERRVVRGMLITDMEDFKLSDELEEKFTQAKRNVPPDVKVSNLTLGEGDSPPGWLASWGLGVLGAFILLIPVGARAGGGR